MVPQAPTPFLYQGTVPARVSICVLGWAKQLLSYGIYLFRICPWDCPVDTGWILLRPKHMCRVCRGMKGGSRYPNRTISSIMVVRTAGVYALMAFK